LYCKVVIPRSQRLRVLKELDSLTAVQNKSEFRTEPLSFQ
jgi:hypothetical protein